MLKKIVAAILRCALALRYRISITGIEKLRNVRSALVLPNHPAEIDPPILLLSLERVLELRPVVLESYYYGKGMNWAMRWLRALPMPDMSFDAGAYKQRRVQRGLADAATALQHGDNILLYPSGGLSNGGMEQIGGRSGVFSILQNYPDAKVFFVRTTGLYGSAFSRALTGSSPDFFAVLLQSIAVLLKNAVFFAPKRDVSIEIVEAPAAFPRQAGIVEMNRWMESWYNKDGPESPALVSRSRWRSDLPQLAPPQQERFDERLIPDEIIDKVKTFLADLAKTPKESITLQSRLGEDLGLDSLNMTDILQWLDEEYAIADVELPEITTVGAVAQAAAHGTKAPAHEPVVAAPPAWTEQLASRPDPQLGLAATIPALFLQTAARMKSHPAVADPRSGILSWPRFVTMTLALASYLRTLPGERIGMMLPASAAAASNILAALLARKTPVMLNWTSGSVNVQHAVNNAGVQKIITSQAFLDRIETDLSFLEDKFVFLERAAAGIPLWRKLLAALQAKLPEPLQQRLFGLGNISPNDPAVILFTSGSETVPKGVPLSHRNILANIEGGLEIVNLKSADVMCGFLPPFHSFGFTITTLVPLLTGIRAVYYPNPNESRKIAQLCASWGVTHVAGTPAFLMSLLKAGTPGHFRALRLYICGAEHAPQALFDAVARITPQAKLLEGYGITECSPMVAGNRMDEPPAGVGRPLTGVEILIVHPETLQPLPEGTRGLVLIRGENVFAGYLNRERDPFVEVQGKRWYNSGDLGIFRGGQLFLSGRLKRFVKIAGEMLSLPALEEALSKRWPPDENGPVLAVVAFEGSDQSRPTLVLATTQDLSLDEANETLHTAGFPYLARLSNIVRFSVLPLLGTGKVDIRSIEQDVKERLHTTP